MTYYKNKIKISNIRNNELLADVFWVSVVLILMFMTVRIYFIYQIAHYSVMIQKEERIFKSEEIAFQNIEGEYFGKLGGIKEEDVLGMGFVKIQNPGFVSRVSSVAFNN